MEDLKGRVKELEGFKEFAERNLKASGKLIMIYRDKATVRFSAIGGTFWIFWLVYSFIRLRQTGEWQFAAMMVLFGYCLAVKVKEGWTAYRNVNKVLNDDE